MTIVRVKSRGQTYLYESESYRNEEGKPRNRRVCIGKIDSKTGREIYHESYLEKMRKAGTPIVPYDDEPQFSVNDVKNAVQKECGLTYFLHKISEKIGLQKVIEISNEALASEIYTLAAHLVVNGNAFTHCKDWLENADLPYSVGDLSSQRISEILQNITFSQRESFFREWAKLRSEQEYLAIDITSTSSYSDLIDDVEWGHNRDGERLAQINLCLLFGESSGYPVYQTTYSGSIGDVKTLNMTLSKFAAITENRPVLSVMDKGFYSKKNVDVLLEDEYNRKFVLAVPFSVGYAKDFVTKSSEIESFKNSIISGKDAVFGVCRKMEWGEKNIDAHVFFNPQKAVREKMHLIADVNQMLENALKEPEKFAQNKRYCRFLKFSKSGENYGISVKESEIENAVKHAGWLVIISNSVKTPKEILHIYRKKDVVEKGFDKLKNDLDLGRLRVHSDNAAQNKYFIGFIALILSCHIHNVMVETGLDKKYTVKQLCQILQKHKVTLISNNRILAPFSKEQLSIFSAFGFDSL